ncbi:MAG: prenyltransferase/squalene oxidase repeat-containing protein [Blastocatellia bacterium]
MVRLGIKRLIILTALTIVVRANDDSHPINAKGIKTDAEAKAVGFLIREVPAWSKENGCFSCHNNGDAARALYAASHKGYRVPDHILADTTEWVRRPARWDANKGDPGFSDKRLADIQFAASLLAAFETGRVKERRPLEQAARKLVAGQSPDGSWKIDAGNTLGSPATYGDSLATYMALRTLKKAALSETRNAVEKAEAWLRQAAPNNVLTAATLLLAAASVYDQSYQSSRQSGQLKQDQCLKLIRAAQTSDGGWGPYADSPPEAFDTAVVLLALSRARRKPGVDEMIRRGRNFLTAQQNPDGSWPATTRPSGGDSYAQLMSTTGWATLALLETR